MEIFQTLKKKEGKGENLGTKDRSRSIWDLHKTNHSVGSHVLWIHILVLTDIMLEGD